MRPDLAAELETEMEEMRGPARLFYDQSRWPASCQFRLAASAEESVERAESRAASRAASPVASRASSKSTASTASTASSEGSSPPVIKHLRACVMCDHVWKAVIPDRGLYVLKCPNCLSDQPGEDELTDAERREMNAQCQRVMAEREAKAAARRKARMVERSRLRMYDAPWTPQLASAHDRALAQAHDCES